MGEFQPWVSDHCPLLFEITSVRTQIKEEHEKLQDLPKSFHFKLGDHKNFLDTLKKPDMVEKLTHQNTIEMDAQILATKITDILEETCDKAGIKAKQKKGNNTSEAWFDVECRNSKNLIKKKCKNLRLNQRNDTLRSEIMRENKKFKKLIKRKKQEYKQGIIQDMKIKNRDKKHFWKLLDKLQKQKKDLFKSSISGKKWNEYFKSILVNEKHAPTLPPDSSEIGVLDYDISLEELKKASYVLKPNKASGYDSLSNEMILGLLEVKPDLLVTLFNKVFKTHQKIKEWSIALISPIFKSGIKMAPGNYRGISVLSCLGKLFSSILNQRLLELSLEKNILSVEQLGFIAGNRTSDAHLILHNLVQSYCHKRGRNIYSCFVDFRKAFDSIPRDILFLKLRKMGINGEIL